MTNECKNSFNLSFIKALSQSNLGNLVAVKNDDSVEYLVVDIGEMEIPQYPIYPVESIERVYIVPKDDDFPVVYCRGTFPIVPHLNVHNNGRKSLCLYDVSYQDEKHLFNANTLLHRIVFWFEQTARNRLHQPNQPLEPFFPGSRDGIILFLDDNIPLIRLEELQTEERCIYQQLTLNDTRKGKVFTLLKLRIKKPHTQNIINKLPTTLGDLDSAFDEPISNEIDLCIPEIWRIKQTPSYQTLFQQSERALRNSGVILTVCIAIARDECEEPEYYTVKAFQLGESYQSLYTAYGYKKGPNGKLEKVDGSDRYKTIPLFSFDVFMGFQPSYAAAFNELVGPNQNYQYVQVGLGALGSQIANNCARSGFGRWCYIDPDTLYPHNLARHCLSEKYIGQNKAVAMQSYVNSLFSNRNDIVLSAIPKSLFDKTAKALISDEISNAHLVVDCSASVAASRYLSHKLLVNTRAVSFFFNPTGTALVMLLEDANRRVPLDILEMQYYRFLCLEPTLVNHLKSDTRVLYSSTCRGTSMVYPQDNAAIFSGIASSQIKTAEASPDACIMVWSLDGQGIMNARSDIDLYEESTCSGWTVKFSSLLKAKLYEQRQQKLPNETGGVLIGSFDFAYKVCYIVDSIDSPEDSLEYPNAYIRGSTGLFDAIRRIEDITIGNLSYIGEWHSHPNNSTCPSKDDMHLLNSIAEFTNQQGNPACMVIVASDHYNVYFKDI